MKTCHYCDTPATHPTKIFDPDLRCCLEVEVCEECQNYLDDKTPHTNSFFAEITKSPATLIKEIENDYPHNP